MPETRDLAGECDRSPDKLDLLLVPDCGAPAGDKQAGSNTTRMTAAEETRR